jgi:hypothetical protein
MANINSVVRKKQRRREKRREKEKKERININIDAKYFLYLLIFLCAISAYFSYVYQDKFAPAKTFVGSILTPMQNGINTAGKYILSKKELLKSKEELILENAKLKEQVASLEALNIEYITDTAELSELRELYSVGQKYSDYPMVAATVISRDSTGLYDVFTVFIRHNTIMRNNRCLYQWRVAARSASRPFSSAQAAVYGRHMQEFIAQCQNKRKLTKRLTDIAMKITISIKSIIRKNDKTLKGGYYINEDRLCYRQFKGRQDIYQK